MYKLEHLPVTREDMLEIARYIARELQNPEAVHSLAEELVAAAESILTFPYVTSVYQTIRPLKQWKRVA